MGRAGSIEELRQRLGPHVSIAADGFRGQRKSIELPEKEFVAHDFRMPFPPTVNHYWEPVNNTGAGYTRFLLSKAGRQYRVDAMKNLLAQRVPAYATRKRLDVTLEFHAPDPAREADIDNRIKPVFDALTKAGFWHDDRQVDRMVVIRGGVFKDDGHVTVKVRPL